MSTVRIEAQLTSSQLLEAVRQLPRSELEQFARRVLALLPRVGSRRLSEMESELIEKINRGFPEALQARYDVLIEKRRRVSLAEEEHRELLELTEKAEAFDAERAVFLSELARLRGKPLSELMEDLGIQSPTNG